MKTKNYYPITTALGTFSALSAAAHAATVQITLLGNKISSTTAGGNTLNADITGDGTDDLSFTNPTVTLNYAGINLYGRLAYARISTSSGNLYFQVVAAFSDTGVGVAVDLGITSPRQATYLNRVTFTDIRINSGVATDAWLEVNAFTTSITSHTVALTRVIFDDASTDRPVFDVIPGTQTEFSAVPEPSGLVLLALGAGGLLTRRGRRRNAP